MKMQLEGALVAFCLHAFVTVGAASGNLEELLDEHVETLNVRENRSLNDQVYSRGIGFDTKIVGGSKVPSGFGGYAWMASLQDGWGHFCGGSLISPTAVLSAAHCGKAKEIVMGVTNQCQKCSGAQSQVSQVPQEV